MLHPQCFIRNASSAMLHPQPEEKFETDGNHLVSFRIPADSLTPRLID